MFRKWRMSMKVFFEFKRVFKRPSTYVVLFLVPVLFVILGSVFFNSFGATNLRIGVYSQDKSPLSKFTVGVVMSLFQGGTIQYVGSDFQKKLMDGELNAVVIIPSNFTISLFSARQTEIKYIPSPVDTQLSAAAYLVFQKLFEDLSGGPFFNPKVLQQMYTSSNVPAPKLVTEKELDFSQVFAPSLILIITMFAALMVGSGLIVYDKEQGLTQYYIVGGIDPVVYYLMKFFVVFFVSFLAGIVSYLIFFLSGFSVDFYAILVIIGLNAIFHSTLGLLISSFSKTSMVSNLFGTTLSVLLLFASGAITSVSSLPELGRKLLNFVPIYNSVYILRTLQLFSESTKLRELLLRNASVVFFGSAIFMVISILILVGQFFPKWYTFKLRSE
jgi:ABC-2 type transport system permease protein